MVNKRGRKRKIEMYFGPDEETAVLKFLSSEDIEERNLVFNQHLAAPLDKMIESIIRRYKLYRKSETFEDLRDDTLSFLMTKAHKFDSTMGYKAYSYFGTICRRYLIGLLQKDSKHLKHVSSYEEMSTDIENRQDLTYEMEDAQSPMDDLIKNLTTGIRLEMDDSNLPPKKKLNENEKKVGEALIEILENWETAFDTMKGGSKYNKNSVLETMRNYTNLSTKDIRLAMKRYKELYKILKLQGL